MKDYKWIWFLCVTCILIYTCKPDFIEIDLSDKQVVLLSPSDNYQTSTLTQTFWWEYTEGALGYELQIVSPSFANTTQLILNISTDSTRFDYTLNPGSYEWRVRAYNGSSTTAYTTYSIKIDSTGSVSSQVLVLISPVDNIITNQMSHTFKWDTLYNADDYRFEIASPDFNGTVVKTEISTGDSATYTFTSEGQYEWRVRGAEQFLKYPLYHLLDGNRYHKSQFTNVGITNQQ